MKPLLALLGILIAPLAHAAQAPIAINIDGIADWMSAAPFIDAGAFFRRWGQPQAGYNEKPGLRLSENNLPLEDADAVSFLRGYPEGVYTLRFEGSATIGFFGFASVVPGTFKTDGNVSTAQVRVGPHKGEDIVSLQVRNVDPKNPLKRLQLLHPGYADDKQIFTNDFLRRVRPFHTIRFMDWQQTNGNLQKEWKNRLKIEHFGRNKGVPVEEMVALANATGRHIWVNIPLMASDDWITQFATCLRDNLHKDAIIRVEYSNELWNSGMPQFRDHLFATRANSNLTKPDEYGKCAQQAADRLGNTARIFKKVFGDKAFDARIRMVIGGFIANHYWAVNQIEWLNAKHPGLVKELAIAPYFGVEGDFKNIDKQGLTADAFFDALDNWIDTQIDGWVKNHEQLAKANNLALVAYEGGNHLTATNGINEDLKRHMQNNRRMAHTYQRLLDNWEKHNGGLFTQFGHISPHTKFGFWGLLETPQQTGSVKWDFFMRRLSKPGDANLDGKVNHDDFKILKANWKKDGNWWESGDFTGDNAVDAADLQLFKQNVQGLTPAQIQEINALK